jgi:hypothetical protein
MLKTNILSYPLHEDFSTAWVVTVIMNGKEWLAIAFLQETGVLEIIVRDTKKCSHEITLLVCIRSKWRRLTSPRYGPILAV